MDSVVTEPPVSITPIPVPVVVELGTRELFDVARTEPEVLVHRNRDCVPARRTNRIPSLPRISTGEVDDADAALPYEIDRLDQIRLGTQLGTYLEHFPVLGSGSEYRVPLPD